MIPHFKKSEGFFILKIFINKNILKNNTLLLEELKRINFVMNYDVDKLVTENEEKKENTIYESKMDKLFIDVESVSVIQEKTLSEQWLRTPPGKPKDALGYWKILFEQLKTAGIGVKWEVANDPVKSTFMYWGPWVIWKDVNRNGGWPISFSGADKKLWLFKFQGGKYAGQPVSNINLESKYISSIFNLGSWGKVAAATGGPELTKLMASKPKTPKATAQDLQMGQQVFKELKYAFDGSGTYEDEAVVAFNKIKNKFQLNELNRLVKVRGEFPNVYEWLKDEMSDYDYSQYRAIWDRLKKIDSNVKAPDVNYAMVAAGAYVKYATPIGFLEKLGEGAKKAYDKLMNMSIEDVMEGFREIVSGVAGTIGTLILSIIPGGNAVNILIYGALVAWDIVQKSQGSKKFSWFNLILDVFSLALSSIGLAKALKPAEVAKPAVAEAKTLPTLFTTLESKFPKIYSLIKGFTDSVGKAAKFVMTKMQAGITWLIEKLPFLSGVGKMLNGAIGKVTGFITSIIEASAGKAATQTLKTTAVQLGKKSAELLAKGTAYLAMAGPIVGSKLITALESKLGSELAKEIDKQIMKKIEAYVGQNATSTVEKLRPGICKMGTKYCNTFDIIMNSATIVKDVTDIVKSGKKNIQSTSDISKAKGYIDKAEATVNTVKGKVETTEKGVKAYDKDVKLAQDIEKKAAPIKKA